MLILFRRSIAVLWLFFIPVSGHADVLVRWDQEQVPSRESLGVSALVVPAKNSSAVENAIARGYRVYVEVEAAAVPGFTPSSDRLAGVVVKGAVPPSQLTQLKQRLGSSGARVVPLEDRGKWPHIRTNWVTKRNEVLQVSSRTAQPWIEQNAALVRIAQAAQPGSAPLLTYPWRPITLSDSDEGPRLEDYLVAIADAGSFGADLVLPLHERFQKNLLLGKPDARRWWKEIRSYIDFYSWNLPNRYRPLANIAIVTADPMASFEVMNLLARHNLPFEIIAPERLAALPRRSADDDSGAKAGPSLTAFNVVIVLKQPQAAQAGVLAEFAKNGGRVIERLNGVADPNAFALEVRRILGREQRVVDIWNGITVLAVPYQEPDGRSVLVTALNYAYEPLPVQMRVRGTFAVVQYESPEEEATLLPHRHIAGYTEFLLPALRIGARVFLSQELQ
jgi:hypothetical protein